jgi:hypothetical protein
MQILSLGLGAFAVFGIFVTVLNSLGKELPATLVTLLALVFVGSFCASFVRGVPFGADLLWRTALGTTCAIGGATLVAGGMVLRTTGAAAPLPTALRVSAALVAAVFVGRITPTTHWRFEALPLTLLVTVVYVATLVLTKEFGPKDVETVRQILRRGRT